MTNRKKRLAQLKALFEVDGGQTLDLILRALGGDDGAKDAVATAPAARRAVAVAYLDSVRAAVKGGE